MVTYAFAGKVWKLGREIMPAGEGLHDRKGRAIIARLMDADQHVAVLHAERGEH